MTSVAQTPKKAETVVVNGQNIYYEVYGKGEPLFLLHGFTQSSKSWLPYVADYENNFEVYLVDIRGHGKSSWFKENISIRSIAKDLDALAGYLKLERINGIGYSYGGDMLIQMELLHPGLIKSMITIGTCGTWHAKEFPEFVEYLLLQKYRQLTLDARATNQRRANKVHSCSGAKLQRNRYRRGA